MAGRRLRHRIDLRGDTVDTRAVRPPRPQVTLGNSSTRTCSTRGTGDYRSSSITTVAPNGEVSVRRAISNPTRTIVRCEDIRRRVATGISPSTFLVYVSPASGINSILTSPAFCRPEPTCIIGTYRVLVWNHPHSNSRSGLRFSAGRTAAPRDSGGRQLSLAFPHPRTAPKVAAQVISQR